MFEDYQDYILGLRDNLIRCGVGFETKSSYSYEELFYLGEAIGDTLWLYNILAIANSRNKLKGFRTPLGVTYQEKLRSILYDEFCEDNKDLSEISVSKYASRLIEENTKEDYYEEDELDKEVFLDENEDFGNVYDEDDVESVQNSSSDMSDFLGDELQAIVGSALLVNKEIIEDEDEDEGCGDDGEDFPEDEWDDESSSGEEEEDDESGIWGDFDFPDDEEDFPEDEEEIEFPEDEVDFPEDDEGFVEDEINFPDDKIDEDEGEFPDIEDDDEIEFPEDEPDDELSINFPEDEEVGFPEDDISEDDFPQEWVDDEDEGDFPEDWSEDDEDDIEFPEDESEDETDFPEFEEEDVDFPEDEPDEDDVDFPEDESDDDDIEFPEFEDEDDIEFPEFEDEEKETFSIKESKGNVAKRVKPEERRNSSKTMTQRNLESTEAMARVVNRTVEASKGLTSKLLRKMVNPSKFKE